MTDPAQDLVVKDRQQWSLVDLLRTRAAEHGDRRFLSFELDDRDVGFAEADRLSDRLAAGLAELGVQPSDNVLLMMRNRAEFVLTWFALNKLGAVEVPVNVDYHGAFLEHIANTSRAEIVVVEDDLVDAVLRSAPRLGHLRTIVVVGEPPAGVPDGLAVHRFDALERPGAPPAHEVRASDISAIHFTSGTTGPAKGAMVTHAHAHLLAERHQQLMRMSAGDVYVTHLPLFHINAQVLAVWNALIVGATARLYQHFSASRWLDEIRDSGGTHTSILGVMLAFLLKQPENDDLDNRLTCVWTVPCPPGPAEEFRERFGIDRIVTSYGMTEIGMVTQQDYDPAVLGSAGPISAQWFDTAIVDPETDEPMPPGRSGELIVRGRVPWIITQGYFGMPDRTAEAFRNLWFHTGDEVVLDEAGRLSFLDRVKDTIRRRGENISSFDVEHALTAHPRVSEAAVVATRADVEGGEDEVWASIVPVPGADLSVEDLWEWADERLPHFAVPRYLEIVDGLPKTPTGKARKFELRARGPGPGCVDRGQVKSSTRRRR